MLFLVAGEDVVDIGAVHLWGENTYYKDHYKASQHGYGSTIDRIDGAT